jgi:hypothetical protein
MDEHTKMQPGVTCDWIPDKLAEEEEVVEDG